MDELIFGENFNRLDDLESVTSHLERFLSSGCYIWVDPDGEKTLLFGRAQVERLKGLKIHIYPNEHPPPHFHVVGPEINATFSINSCKLLTGEIGRKNQDLVVWWHERARAKLIKFWDDSRPLDCPVGRFREE